MGALKWVGQPGQFVAGVPARDLTAAEVERYPEAAVSPLYAEADDPHPHPLPSRERGPEGEAEAAPRTTRRRLTRPARTTED